MDLRLGETRYDITHRAVVLGVVTPVDRRWRDDVARVIAQRADGIYLDPDLRPEDPCAFVEDVVALSPLPLIVRVRDVATGRAALEAGAAGVDLTCAAVTGGSGETARASGRGEPRLAAIVEHGRSVSELDSWLAPAGATIRPVLDLGAVDDPAAAARVPCRWGESARPEVLAARFDLRHDPRRDGAGQAALCVAIRRGVRMVITRHVRTVVRIAAVLGDLSARERPA